VIGLADQKVVRKLEAATCQQKCANPAYTARRLVGLKVNIDNSNVNKAITWPGLAWPGLAWPVSERDHYLL